MASFATSLHFFSRGSLLEFEKPIREASSVAITMAAVVCCICGEHMPVKTGSAGNWGRTVAMSGQDLLTVNVIRATTGKAALTCKLGITTRRCINCCAPVKEAFKRIREQREAQALYGSLLDEPREKKMKGKPPTGIPLIGERLRVVPRPSVVFVSYPWCTWVICP